MREQMSNYHNATAEQVAYAIVARLMDNYDWGGSIDDADRILVEELIGKAISESKYFSMIEELCMNNGVIESDYFYEISN